MTRTVGVCYVYIRTTDGNEVERGALERIEGFMEWQMLWESVGQQGRRARSRGQGLAHAGIVTGNGLAVVSSFFQNQELREHTPGLTAQDIFRPADGLWTECIDN